MRILELFDKYFLILMIIQGLILIIDSKGFSSWNMKDTSRKSKSMGIGIIIIAVVLYLVTMYSS
ncbi:hypothetical protein JMF89_01635 [Clostridiaceae bacterium UIB06]|uniref:Uncharacterized protein n=1 Tax=Clostridium thailandense TaxID=2794346 RepID=A0A949THK0_9CLOT|nr:CLC_0170 family protein [Clostridium thailandense]MBV7272370.1 hypothetical protein [Clostridium thailandense]MCH5135917.1 hypothetical protein [Clostridiaceae bacterium UIB06]